VLAWVASFFLERLPSSVSAFERKETYMQNGTIKKLVLDRGFGFIAAEDGKEYFFHRSGTDGDFDRLQGGERVSFEVETSPKGPRAAKVQVL
jgi:CspA family cold shock protein